MERCHLAAGRLFFSPSISVLPAVRAARARQVRAALPEKHEPSASADTTDWLTDILALAEWTSTRLGPFGNHVLTGRLRHVMPCSWRPEATWAWSGAATPWAAPRRRAADAQRGGLRGHARGLRLPELAVVDRGRQREPRRNTAALPAAVYLCHPFFLPPFAVETFLRRHGSP